MKNGIKAIFIVILVFFFLFAPLYAWKVIDQDSYENFWLHSVSPFSLEERNQLLKKRNSAW